MLIESIRQRPRLLAVSALVLVGALSAVGYSYMQSSALETDTGPVENAQEQVLDVKEIFVYSAGAGEQPTGTYSTTTRKMQNEVLVKTWKHEQTGTSVSLYTKDLFRIVDNYVETASSSQMLLKLRSADGTERMLHNFEPSNVRIANFDPDDAKFSPLGTYFWVHVRGYEGSYVMLYDLSSGRSILRDYGYTYDVTEPFWNKDETKLALLRHAQSIDGTVAALFYSSTGRVEDAKLVKDFPDSSVGSGDAPYVGDLTFDYEPAVLTFDMELADGSRTWSEDEHRSHGNVETYRFDLATGTLTFLGKTFK